jgi:hypothetical protein
MNWIKKLKEIQHKIRHLKKSKLNKYRYYTGYGENFFEKLAPIFQKVIVEELAADFLAFTEIPNAKGEMSAILD